jgi:V8-like Glu-specific endopeptidase
MWCIRRREDSVNSYEIEPKTRFSKVDHRKNIYEIKDRGGFYPIAAERSESVACMINQYYFRRTSDGEYFVDTETLNQHLQWSYSTQCGEQESFLDEPVPGSATAFLVDNRFILTAGHVVCKNKSDILNEERIRKTLVVFGFQKNQPNQSTYKFKEKDIYRIRKVVAYRYSQGADWALIKVDRAVEGRTPLRIDFVSEISLNADLYMLGHPSGLPLKFVDGAKVRNIRPSSFQTDLDGFGGNSGSPVFDKTRHLVIGILVSGPARDYHVTENYRNTGLRRVQVRQVNSAFEGFENVQKVNRLLFVQHYLLAKRGDLRAQHQVALDYNYGENGVPVNFTQAMKWLQKAASRGHVQSKIDLKTLPEKNAARILTLRGNGLCYYQTADTVIHVAAVLTGIVTLPFFALPGMELSLRLTRSLESRFFELLALDDARFRLFEYISSGELNRAEEELERHADFYFHLVKTRSFKNKLSESKPEYIRFFQNKNMIPRNVWLSPQYSIF